MASESLVRRVSPLPFAFAWTGALLPLLVLWSAGPLPDGQPRGHYEWAISVSMLSGLVSACIGVLARDSKSWVTFGAIAIGLGTAFGTFIALVSFQAPLTFLPLVIPFAIACAAALTVTGGFAVFAAHRRQLAARPGSLLEQLERSRLWLVTSAVITAGAWLVQLLGTPSVAAVLIAASATIFAIAFWLADRRAIARVRVAVSEAGPLVESEDPADTLHDLGVGEQRWRVGMTPEPYRNPPQSLLVVRGCVETGRRRAARVTRTDAIVGSACVLAVAHTALLWAAAEYRTAAEVEVVQPAPVPPAVVRAGAWYPGQAPILVDLDHDGVPEIISLRWDSSDESRALFVTAHDGATLEPLWSTEPLPSQWMSPDTHLLKSGDALFLSDSEKKLHFYALATGTVLGPPLELEPLSSICALDGDPPRVWALTRDAWRERKEGLLIDARGSLTEGARPENCRDWAPPLESEWDAKCHPELRKAQPELEQVALARKADVGLAFWTDDGAPTIAGYDPGSCKLRWQSSLGFDGRKPHHRPALERRVEAGVLYTLHQLDDGSWQVGAREAKSGSVLWYTPLPRAERGANLEDLFVDELRVYVARDWKLDVIDRKTGAYYGAI